MGLLDWVMDQVVIAALAFSMLVTPVLVIRFLI